MNVLCNSIQWDCHTKAVGRCIKVCVMVAGRIPIKKVTDTSCNGCWKGPERLWEGHR